ncbi:hypothetical protein [Planktothricoides raciborskii]|uniref:Uncharacterized protein n=1 Tax=Planktothricoides raciborskii GIHE-MW2 TaxID=2792601 RepID=A0AAU8JKU3_9CYAN
MSNKNITVIDSKKDNCPLSPGESYEKYVYLEKGSYRTYVCPYEYKGIKISGSITANLLYMEIMADLQLGLEGRKRFADTINKEGFLDLELFYESGKRFASNTEDFEITAGLIHFSSGSPVNFKFKVSRIGGNYGKIDFIVMLQCLEDWR